MNVAIQDSSMYRSLVLLFLSVLIGLGAWNLKATVDLQSRVARLETRIEFAKGTANVQEDKRLSEERWTGGGIGISNHQFAFTFHSSDVGIFPPEERAPKPQIWGGRLTK